MSAFISSASWGNRAWSRVLPFRLPWRTVVVFISSVKSAVLSLPPSKLFRMRDTPPCPLGVLRVPHSHPPAMCRESRREPPGRPSHVSRLAALPAAVLSVRSCAVLLVVPVTETLVASWHHPAGSHSAIDKPDSNPSRHYQTMSALFPYTRVTRNTHLLGVKNY